MWQLWQMGADTAVCEASHHVDLVSEPDLLSLFVVLVAFVWKQWYPTGYLNLIEVHPKVSEMF